MVFHKYIPGSPLDSYVDCILYIEGNNKGAGFPKTAMSLVFNLNDPFKLFTDKGFTRFIDYKKYWVAGFQTQPSYVESYGTSKMIVVQFKTQGAYAFLHQPLHHFTNQYIDLDCIFSRSVDDTWEQLKEAGSVHEQFLLTEKFLYQQLLTTPIPHGKLLSSIDLLLNHKGPVSIAAICQQYSISRKHLNFLFQEYLGISPKMLSSLNRFQSILFHISRSRPDKLTTLAYDLDFFDQSHFNNHFRQFTGLKPTDYLKHAALTPSLKIVPHFLPAE